MLTGTYSLNRNKQTLYWRGKGRGGLEPNFHPVSPLVSTVSQLFKPTVIYIIYMIQALFLLILNGLYI